MYFISSLHYLSQSKSTNDDIINLDHSLEDTFGVYTLHQTNGRGQYGNRWNSQPHQNIAYSLLLRKTLTGLPAVLFNFYTALLVREFLANLTSQPIELKWPNDIILNRKKIGGILIETSKQKAQEYYIIGIGINVLQTDFGEITSASSLWNECKDAYPLHSIAENLHRFFSEKIVQNPSETFIISQYNSFLFKKNEPAIFSIKGKRQNGIIEKVDSEGYLWVNLENEGLQKFFHKQIELLY